MPEIIPIRDLKNTNAISQRCHETAEPIFVTKNGYGDMVIMSMEAYEHQQIMNEVWFKSEILCPKRLMFKSDSYYYETLQPAIRAGMKRKRGLPMKKNTHNSEETA